VTGVQTCALPIFNVNTVVIIIIHGVMCIYGAMVRDSGSLGIVVGNVIIRDISLSSVIIANIIHHESIRSRQTLG
jgi:hypothetical protein